MNHRLLICATLLMASGCGSGSSSSITNVFPKHPETLNEVEAPNEFDYSLTRTVNVQVEIASGAPGVAIVQEPDRRGYDPFAALSKGVVSSTNEFAPSVRVGASAVEIPVLLYRNGAFEERSAFIGSDDTARVVFP